MVRKQERKTDRGKTRPDIILKAVRAVKIHNLSIRQAALEFKMNYRTLSRYCKKIPEEDYLHENIVIPTVHVGYAKNKQIFTNSQEQQLVDYILHASDIYFGLFPKEIRTLAYNLACYNSIQMPPSWIKNKMAGEDWFTAFIKRYNKLPIRKPEARAISSNRTNVERFYKNVDKIMSHYDIKPKDIWNMDEIGITTVQIPDKVVARKNYKQVKNMISAEHENLVTLACIVSAIGNQIPPFFVFPHVHFKDHFIALGPSGSSGTANKLSWMQKKDFEQFLRHFHSYVKCTTEKPVLLLLNNYGSYLSIEGLNYAKQNGIIMLSFPLHCSYKLQPLDKTICELLKKYINSACDAWILNHSDHDMTIYNIPEVIAIAYPLAMTPSNIQAGFKCTGIFPFNKDVFTDLDFGSSFITIRSLPEENKLV